MVYVSTIFYLNCMYIIFSRTLHLDIIKPFYLPTDAQEFCFKRNIKVYIKMLVFLM